MFWQVAVLALIFLIAIGYYMLSGISPNTRDLETMKRLNLRLRWLLSSRQAFDEDNWRFRRFGTRLLPAIFPVLKEDLKQFCRRGRKWLGYAFLIGLYAWYGLLWAKSFCLLGEAQDLRVCFQVQHGFVGDLLVLGSTWARSPDAPDSQEHPQHCSHLEGTLPLTLNSSRSFPKKMEVHSPEIGSNRAALWPFRS